MLRVGLTGGLGSGKSTVAKIFVERGARAIAADEVARRLMQPGEEVYAAILDRFGADVVKSDGSLDRVALAELSFQQHQADALNRIVHPATVAAEREWMRDVFEQDPSAIAIVESALIFEVQAWGTVPGWLECFDKLILVTAPDDVKVERFVARAMNAAIAQIASSAVNSERKAVLERDARARLRMQIPDREKAPRCDYVLSNAGPIEETRKAVEAVCLDLQAANWMKIQKQL